MNIEKLINSYLKKSLLLQIATSCNGIPWICTVCFAYDSNYNLYWFSRHKTRHSQDIVQNPQIAGAVVPPYTLGDKSVGLQFTGTASEIFVKQEVSLGLDVLQKRYGVKNKRIRQLRQEILSGSADYGLYRLLTDSIVLHDTLNFPESPRHVFVSGRSSGKYTVQSHSQEHQ